MKVVKHSKQVSQRGCGCPIPGNTQGQAEWGSEQSGLVENVIAEDALDDLERPFPTQTFLWF